MASRLPRHARILLAIFANATTPLCAADAIEMLQKQVTLRSISTGFRLAAHLRKVGLVRFTEITPDEAVQALRNIVQSIGKGGSLPSLGRYEVTDRGRAYLRRRTR